MKILYIDPLAGISGDMMVSALIDAGAPFGDIASLLGRIPHPLPEIAPVKEKQGIMDGIHLQIAPSSLHLPVAEMQKIIGAVRASDRVRDDALSMLKTIVNAEAAVHGLAPDDVHLHELSHIDTLIDVLAVAQAVDSLGIEAVFAGPVPFGRGTIKTEHGLIPNPAPATVMILKGFPVTFLDTPLELTTPTGAAIIGHYVNPSRQPPAFHITATGCGLGSYPLEIPDLLRVYVGNTDDPSPDEEIWVMETDMDDTETEYLGAVAERLMAEGARDVLYFPVNMKKGRVGIRLSVSSASGDVDSLTAAIFRETSTFGLRMHRELRRTLKRKEEIVETPYGPVRIKKGFSAKGELIKSHIEFDDVKRLAEAQTIPYRELLRRIRAFLDGPQ
jgi:pyridinium-3,5-bisthiocarboxylic acid mononucleotide nickel chelatase